jgi:CRISPR/Cas system CSM-associated protein Csm3 (group 7 of RAMP superfamily)
MARNIHSRWQISGRAITTSPISVGGMGSGAIVDLALAIDGQGNYYIPGTSLAGALRGWMERNYRKDIVDKLFGHQEDKGKQGGHASFITIADISINSKNLYFEVRDGVAIDRDLGTAADNFKYDRAVLPRGTEFDVKIVIERDSKIDEAEWEKYKQAIAHLLHAFKNGKIPLGAAKTRGLGRVKLKELTDWNIITQNFQSRKGILAAIGYPSIEDKSVDKAPPFAYTSTSTASQSAYLAIAIHWHPVEPVMVKAEGEGIAVDMLPLTSAIGDNLTFVLPGSSIKGSLRTQAERIVRTVKGLGIISNENLYAKSDYPTQIDVPLVRELFGKAAKMERETQQGYIGALSAIDCYANLVITNQQWASIESATTETNLRNSLDAVGLSDTKQAMHVAIDRWTGGAADGMLYSTLEPIGFGWEPIMLEIDLGNIKELRDEAIALILLVLRDMMLTKIPLGYATNRGMGSITVDSINITGEGLAANLAALTKVSLTGSNLNSLDRELLTMLTNKWKAWIGQETPVEAGAAK